MIKKSSEIKIEKLSFRLTPMEKNQLITDMKKLGFKELSEYIRFKVFSEMSDYKKVSNL